MDDNTKKKLEEILKREEEKKIEDQRIQDLKSRNRAISDLIRLCYASDIEKHLRFLVDEIDNKYKENKIIGHIVMPGIRISSVNDFYQWISLLNNERIELSVRSLLSNDGTSFKQLPIEINGVSKEIIGYGIIKDPKGIGYNFIFTYFNNECDLYLLENINHAKPCFNNNSKPIEYNELDLRITRIKNKASDIIINVIIDKIEIRKKLEELISNNL